MLMISICCAVFLKIDGPRTLAEAKPSGLFPNSYFRNASHTNRAQNFSFLSNGVACLSEHSSLPPRPIFMHKYSASNAGWFTHAIFGTETTGLNLERTL